MPRISYEEFTWEFLLPYELFQEKYIDAPIKEIERCYREECVDTPLPEIFPEAKEVLQKLHDKGFHMTLFTALNGPRLRREMESMGVADFFKNPRSSLRAYNHSHPARS